MAARIAIVTIVALAAWTGIIWGIMLPLLGLAVASLFIGKNRDRFLVLVGMAWIAVMAYYLGIARGGWIGALLAATITYTFKFTIRFDADWPSKLGLVLIPGCVLVLGHNYHDSDIALVSSIWFGLTLPDPWGGVRCLLGDSRKYTRLIGAVATTACIGSIIILGPMQKVARSAVLEFGKWGLAFPILKAGSPLDQAHFYSYSLFADLVGAERLTRKDIDQLSKFQEAFVIIPTEPIPKQDIAKIESWVNAGGHLIVIVDHTDVFGHARVASAILSPFKMQTALTSFFIPNSKALAQFIGTEDWPLKTATVPSGFLALPIASARWIEESPDYGERNFFGPLRPSDDDGYGRKPVAVTARRGRGQVTVWGDSTIFANFAILQPGNTEILNWLRDPSIFSRVGWLVAVILLIWVPFCDGRLRRILILAAIGSSILLVIPSRSSQLRWPENAVSFAGDWQAVHEGSPQSKSISTAYVSLPAFGVFPKWTSKPKPDAVGVWIGNNPPPGPSWRWVSCEASRQAPEELPPFLLDVLSQLGTKPPKPWSPDNRSSRHLAIGGVWTNDAVGDWWFDVGVSRSKRTRLEAFAAYLTDKPMPDMPKPAAESKETIHVLINVAGGKPIYGRWPSSWFKFNKPGDELYLGAGISVRVIDWDRGHSLMATKQFIEGNVQKNGFLVSPSNKN
jgi:hypothetical protein